MCASGAEREEAPIPIIVSDSLGRVYLRFVVLMSPFIGIGVSDF